MLPNQFLELLYRYTSRPITSFLHRRAESVRSSSQPLVVCAGTSALELSRAGSGLMTRLVSGAEVRTREGRVEDETARTQAPSPTSSSARRRRRRPAGARSRGRTGPIVVVKSRGISLGNKPSRGCRSTPRATDRPTSSSSARGNEREPHRRYGRSFSALSSSHASLSSASSVPRGPTTLSPSGGPDRLGTGTVACGSLARPAAAVSLS